MPMFKKLRLNKWTIQFANYYGDSEVAVVYAATEKEAVATLRDRVTSVLSIKHDVEIHVV